MLAKQQKIYIHQLCVNTECSQAVLPIGMEGKRESTESVLLIHLDDDEFLYGINFYTWLSHKIFTDLIFIFFSKVSSPSK